MSETEPQACVEGSLEPSEALPFLVYLEASSRAPEDQTSAAAARPATSDYRQILDIDNLRSSTGERQTRESPGCPQVQLPS
jgi:hypothetical protein